MRIKDLGVDSLAFWEVKNFTPPEESKEDTLTKIQTMTNRVAVRVSFNENYTSVLVEDDLQLS